MPAVFHALFELLVVVADIHMLVTIAACLLEDVCLDVVKETIDMVCIVDTESVVITMMTIAARRMPFATLRFTRA